MTQTATKIEALETLRPGRQWVCYNENKAPISPITLKGVSGDLAEGNTDWASYEEAVRAWQAHKSLLKGVGREFIKSQKITGVDLDDCINEQGELSPYAQYVVKLLNSYTEYSPSERGLHIWVHGTLPSNLNTAIKEDGDKRTEAYDCNRYFTITGKHMPGTPTTLKHRQAELDSLHKEVSEWRQAVKQPRPTNTSQIQTQQTSTGNSPYGLKALACESAIMASTPEGSRETTLNNACLKMGSLIAGGELTRETVEQELRNAARQSGLPEREIETKISRSIPHGMITPRSAPQHNDWQQIEESILKMIADSGTSHDKQPQKGLIALAIAERNEEALYACTQEIAQLDKKKIARLKRAIRVIFGNTFSMRDFEDILRDEQRKLEDATPYIPEIKSARALMKVQFKPVDWTVDKILVPGLIALAGKQKIGKSWLDLMLAISVAYGGLAFQSIPVKAGDVLYMALEDNERRLQERIQKLLAEGQEIPDTFDYVTQWPRMDTKGVAALERWIQSKPNPRLIIIDPWVKVKPRIKQRAGETGYDADYEALQEVKRLADTYNVCILVQFHVRKAAADDPFDEVNATSGVTACADGFLSLKRGRGEADATLWGTGRDYREDVDLALSFNDGFWKILGNASEYSLSKASKEVIDALEAEDKPLYPKEIAAILGMEVGTIRKRLFDMRDRGEVKDTGRGYIPMVGNGSNGGNTCNDSNGGNAHPFKSDQQWEIGQSVTQRYIPSNGHVTPIESRAAYLEESSVTSVTSVTSNLSKEEEEARKAMIQREYETTHPVKQCCTVYEGKRGKSGIIDHHQYGKKMGVSQDDSSQWWCEQCIWQRDLMNIACILNYPKTKVYLGGKEYSIDGTKTAYLRFAQMEGYDLVKAALRCLEQKQEQAQS